jgi:ATPase subunit of ABC transporter with duplicated ATPase domains
VVIVIGRVGDGKSSLLGAMLGKMTRSDGSVTIRGEIAYFRQTSWILSATVKDNIVLVTAWILTSMREFSTLARFVPIWRFCPKDT